MTPQKTAYRSQLQFLCVEEQTPLHEILRRQAEATKYGLPAGIALVTDANGVLLGTITDGDVRRAILKLGSLDVVASQAMTRDPIVFPEGTSFRNILALLPAELDRRGRRSRRFLGKIVIIDEQRRPIRVLDYHQLWEQRVATHRHVVVVGMGYVGLTLALAMAEDGYRVTGVEADPERVALLMRKESYVHEQGLLELLREQIGKQLHVSTGMPEDGDVFIISVGTPVGAGDNGAIPHPRLTELQDSARQVGEHLTPGSLVILRSTVPVGTTREVVLPLLEAASGLEGGTDFHLAFAPERTAEGRALKELRSLPQLIGGVNQDSTEAAAALFRELTPNIVRMESCEAAELAKLINNCFRDVIFAFSNEIARIAAPFNLDVVEVINAANRGYPRDPVPLPSPGVGGPCLTKDPYIFASMASRAGVPDGLSVRSRRINEDMHGFVATRILQQLTELGKDPKQCTLLLCGLAFKGQPETGDLRNSSGLEIARLLAPRVGRLLGHDPVASPDDIAAAGLTAAEYPADATKADAVLFLNNHPSYATSDVFELVRSLRGPALIFDGWHLFRPDDVIRAAPCVYMGLGFTRSSVAQPARS